jgi:hypothetical protein
MLHSRPANTPTVGNARNQTGCKCTSEAAECKATSREAVQCCGSESRNTSGDILAPKTAWVWCAGQAMPTNTLNYSGILCQGHGSRYLSTDAMHKHQQLQRFGRAPKSLCCAVQPVSPVRNTARTYRPARQIATWCTTTMTSPTGSATMWHRSAQHHASSTKSM